MLYLFSFLTMLIGLLIYMMDPVPTDLRRKEDVAGAEAYIVGFVNQHQAAKDYLYQWLGRVYPLDGSKAEVYSIGSNSINNDFDAAVVAIPGLALDKTMDPPDTGISMELERQIADDTDKIGHLQSAGGIDKKGSYFSALMCLDDSDVLTRCYKYDCDGATGKTSCSDSGTIKKVYFAEGVVPYAITYSTLEQPAWWDDKVPSKALRQRLWYRALTNRTHASESCGVLLYADEGHWEKRSRNRVDWVTGNTPPKYCISNGQRCVRILPAGAESFLKKVLVTDDLEGVFFCMTAYKNPYEGTPMFNYDGIDHYASGGGGPDNGNVWYPVEGSFEQIDVSSWGGGLGLSSVTKKFALTSTLSSVTGGFTMPFNHTTNDFTLTFIMNFGDSESGNDGWYVGPDTNTDNGYFGVHQKSNVLWFHPHQGLGEDSANPSNLAPRFIEDATGVNSDINVSGPEYYTKGTHSWTIVRKSGRMFLYLDGWWICSPEGDDGWEAQTSPSGTAPAVVIGAVPTSIGAIRYYSGALNGRQIKKNFEVDSRRYGITKQRSPEGDAFCEIVPPTP